MSCIKGLTFRSLQDVGFWGSLNIILIHSAFPPSPLSCFSFLNTFLRKSISLSLLSKSASLVHTGVRCAWCLSVFLWALSVDICIGRHPIDPESSGSQFRPKESEPLVERLWDLHFNKLGVSSASGMEKLLFHGLWSCSELPFSTSTYLSS